MKIYKLKKAHESETTKEEQDKLLGRNKRLLTAKEILENCQGEEYTDYFPCETSEGLLARGYLNYFYYIGGGHLLIANRRPSYRFGVLATDRNECENCKKFEAKLEIFKLQ